MVKKKVTIKDVAEQCQVSAPTVSRILNNRLDKFPVREETIERVRRIAKELGYSPNRFAQSLRSRKSKFIGFSLPYEFSGADLSVSDSTAFQNPVMSQMIVGVLECIQMHGYSLVMIPRRESGPEETQPDEVIFPDVLDGLLYLTPTLNHQEYLSIYDSRPQMVLLGHCPNNSALPSCDIDNMVEMRRLTEHMIQAGARKLALVLPLPERFIVMQDRRDGYAQALAAAGIPFRPEYISYNADKMGFPHDIKQMLHDHPEIDGLIVGDTYQLDMLQAIEETGRRTPDDLFFATFGDHDACQGSEKRITAMVIPFLRMAFVATQMLIGVIEGKPPCAPHRLINAKLVERASTRRA